MKFNLTVNTKEKELIQDYNNFKSPFNHFKLIEIQEKIIEKYFKLVDSENNIENKHLFLSGGMISLVTSLPYIEKSLSPFFSTIPLQLLAYHVALLKKCDIDKPRNLAKSVTVE